MKEFNDYNEHFENCVQTLKNRGCSQAILEEIENQRGQVLEQVTKMEIRNGHIPFLPVIPQSILSLKDLRDLLDRPGRINTKPYSYSFDFEKCPENVYFVYDVDIGQELSKRKIGSAKTAQQKISQGGRLCLTIAEVLALYTHTEREDRPDAIGCADTFREEEDSDNGIFVIIENIWYNQNISWINNDWRRDWVWYPSCACRC